MSLSDPSASRRGFLGPLGALAGGVLGYAVFFWLVRQGFYALALPGAALGLGAGLAAGRNAPWIAAGYGGAGLLLTLFCEWRFAPFVADGSLGYFVTHLHQLRPMTWILAGVGAYAAYRLALGFGRTRVPERGEEERS